MCESALIHSVSTLKPEGCTLISKIKCKKININKMKTKACIDFSCFVTSGSGIKGFTCQSSDAYSMSEQQNKKKF